MSTLFDRYINFTFNEEGGGAVKILVHWLNLGRKLVLFHIFNTFWPIFSIIWYIFSLIWQIFPLKWPNFTCIIEYFHRFTDIVGVSCRTPEYGVRLKNWYTVKNIYFCLLSKSYVVGMVIYIRSLCAWWFILESLCLDGVSHS